MTPMEINFKYEGDMRVSVYQTLSLMIAFGLLIVAVLKEQKK
ncbi:putative holin-like toxin [Lacticaseibacillus paracasei]|nr:putative holin-like toxin [Lacticaseibacillus paracasei]MBZ3797898.1 putative holin-like toxin [Lacticaseibacillus paracasei]